MIKGTPSYREMMRMTHDDFVEILELIEPDITRCQVIGSHKVIIESLSTGTFLHDGGLFFKSELDRELCFWREFLFLAARVLQRRTYAG